MKICTACKKAHKENGWYLTFDLQITPKDQCDYHPVLTNWRVVRTLKTLKYWSRCGEDYRHPHIPGVRMCLSFQRVHRRTAEAVLFDYEKPFIDLLIEKGYLEQEENFDDVNRVLRVLPAADDYLKSGLGQDKYAKFQEELRQLALKDVPKKARK